jgi:hypothetical protein
MLVALDQDLRCEKSRDIQWRICSILQVIEPLNFSNVTVMLLLAHIVWQVWKWVTSLYLVSILIYVFRDFMPSSVSFRAERVILVIVSIATFVRNYCPFYVGYLRTLSVLRLYGAGWSPTINELYMDNSSIFVLNFFCYSFHCSDTSTACLNELVSLY